MAYNYATIKLVFPTTGNASLTLCSNKQNTFHKPHKETMKLQTIDLFVVINSLIRNKMILILRIQILE